VDGDACSADFEGTLEAGGKIFANITLAFAWSFAIRDIRRRVPRLLRERNYNSTRVPTSDLRQTFNPSIFAPKFVESRRWLGFVWRAQELRSDPFFRKSTPLCDAKRPKPPHIGKVADTLCGAGLIGQAPEAGSQGKTRTGRPTPDPSSFAAVKSLGGLGAKPSSSLGCSGARNYRDEPDFISAEQSCLDGAAEGA